MDGWMEISIHTLYVFLFMSSCVRSGRLYMLVVTGQMAVMLYEPTSLDTCVSVTSISTSTVLPGWPGSSLYAELHLAKLAVEKFWLMGCVY